MRAFLYLNEPRVKGTYSQVTGRLVSKMTAEESSSIEASLSARLLAVLTSALKASKGGKKSTETVLTHENMVIELIKLRFGIRKTKLIGIDDHWQSVEKGDMVLFMGLLELDSYDLSKQELWRASVDEMGQGKLRHDLRLSGLIGGRQVEIPLSSNWITSPSQFTALCHGVFGSLEGLAIILTSPTIEPVMLQPLALGVGFVESDS